MVIFGIFLFLLLPTRSKKAGYTKEKAMCDFSTPALLEIIEEVWDTL